ncbi:hypothetical protein JCM11251_002229 [Rhodosporidiobolus azoricus]
MTPSIPFTSSPSGPTSTSPTAMPGISLGLQRIARLLTHLKSPQCAVPVIHIAGTNGKGSVSAYISSILSSANSPLRVGRFNSPHMVDEWDCIRLPRSANTVPARSGSDPFLSPVSERLFRSTKREVEQLSLSHDVGATSFEILTATAYTIFARAQPSLDVAVVEVGMGGAEDATNVVPAEKTLLSIVTAVDLDHQKFLGDTVAEIAAVKGGITRKGGDVVLAQQAHPEAVEAVKRLAGERKARVWEAAVGTLLPSSSSPSSSTSSDDLPSPPLVSLPLLPLTIPPSLPSHALAPSPGTSSTITTPLPLPGSYQLSNSAVACLSAQLLRSLPRTKALVPALERVTDKAIAEGIERTTWEGRLSWTTLPCPLPPTFSSSSSAFASPTPSAPVHSRRLLLDGAHNPASASLLSNYLLSLPPHLKPSTLIFALSSPRLPSSVLPPLLKEGTGVKRVVCTGFGKVEGMEWVRSVESGELADGVKEVVEEMGRRGEVEVLQAESAEEAMRLLDRLDLDGQKERGSTLVAGSLYLVADVLRTQRRLEEGRMEDAPS